MTEQQTLVEFLKKRLDEDERWARLVSQPPTDLDPAPENGVHWEWILGDGAPLEIPDPASKRADGMLTEHGTLAWLATVEKFHHDEGDDPAVAGYCDGIHDMEGPAAAHIARHDPARVLREVAAKRAILELHDGMHECSTYRGPGDIDNCSWCIDSEDCSTIQALAAVYSDHPDYDQSWQP